VKNWKGLSMPFDRPEQQEYLEWLDSLPECDYCGGSGEISGDYDGEERDCDRCQGSGKIFPEPDGGEDD
jgi:DnaJ-class molecular chaperone